MVSVSSAIHPPISNRMAVLAAPHSAPLDAAASQRVLFPFASTVPLANDLSINCRPPRAQTPLTRRTSRSTCGWTRRAPSSPSTSGSTLRAASGQSRGRVHPNFCVVTSPCMPPSNHHQHPHQRNGTVRANSTTLDPERQAGRFQAR